jgi:hypothetical protein
MSFQFIFSLILVGVVVFVAFFAIQKFLGQAEKIKLLDFPLKISTAAIELWGSNGGLQRVDPIALNPSLTYVCFANSTTVQRGCSSNSIFSSEFTPIPSEYKQICGNISSLTRTSQNANMFYYPASVARKYGVSPAQEVYCSEKGQPLKKCLNMEKITCVPVKAGSISFRLEKENVNTLIKIVK